MAVSAIPQQRGQGGVRKVCAAPSAACIGCRKPCRPRTSTGRLCEQTCSSGGRGRTLGVGRHGPDPSPPSPAPSSRQAVQQELRGQRGLRPDVLRPRLQCLHGGGGGEVSLQVPLVLLRGVQEVPAAGGEIRLQIAPEASRHAGGLPRVSPRAQLETGRQPQGMRRVRQGGDCAGSLDSSIAMEDPKLSDDGKPKPRDRPLPHLPRARQRAALLRPIGSIQRSVSSWGPSIYHFAHTGPFLQG